ncbi:hypothetical protein EDC04DRAFT_2991991 [Pisolithus marmoratus]|nr:hypothetical protein EDC04DRAFT_2991991 [Pisolithus marmoratus]
MTQLKRTREHPLDLVIIDYYEASQSEVDDLLDIFVPNTNRWRSLHVKCVQQNVLSHIVHKLDGLEFPCLESVFIDRCNIDQYPRFLSPSHSPALRHLDLAALCGTEELLMATNPLATLRLLSGRIIDQSFLSRIPTQSLTMFTFGDYGPRGNGGWVLERDSLHFPLLQRLVLYTADVGKFMDAIVAPKLEHFDYSYRYDSTLGTFGPKFSHVRQLTLQLSRQDDDPTVSTMHMLCQAFPGFLSQFYLGAAPLVCLVFQASAIFSVLDKPLDCP